jgi:hypothetical protein
VPRCGSGYRPGRGWRTAAVAAAIGCAAATQAHAESFFEIEVGIGGSAYQHGPNGLWYQDGFQHELDLTAPMFEVGFTGDAYQAAHWGISWHLDWAWLGTIHTDAMVPSANTNTTSGHWDGPDLVGVNTSNPCSGPCNNLSDFKGTGHDQGFFAAVEPHLDFGGWRFGIEGGPYLHRSTWAEDVANWVPYAGAAPRGNQVHYAPKWVLGWMAGASIEHDHLSITYQYFHNSSPGSADNSYVPIWKATHVLMARYRF